MSSERAPLRLALVGCGGVAAAWLQALPRVPELRLSAIVEPDPARRRDAAERTGAPAHPDLGPLLEDPPDAALVLTPPARHAEIATRLLDAGAHVLCEKPMATSADAARAMLAAAGRAGRLLMPSSKFRYVPAIAEARAMLRNGAIGQVLLYENAFCSAVDMTGRWNGRRDQAGGGVLIDNGSHAADLARFLLGPVARVTAAFGPQVQELEVEDSARVLFETADGTYGLACLSWSVEREDPWYLRILGSRGALEVGWHGSRWRRDLGAWCELGGGYDKAAAFAAQLADFAGAIRGQPARVDAADGLASVRVVEAAYRAAALRAWTEVEP